MATFLQTEEATAAIDRMKTGGSESGLNLTHERFRRLVVPVPSIAEQRRIIRILDEAFDGIATAMENTAKNLQNARALFPLYLDRLFDLRGEGWANMPLGDLASFRNGINFTKSSRGESLKIVGVKDFQQRFWAPLDGLDTVVADGEVPEPDRLREHDILFVRSNGNVELIGRSLLVGKVAERTTHSGFVIRARLNDGDNPVPRYLSRFLKSSNARRTMINGGTGTNIKSLNQAILSALVVPLPAVAEQVRIADRLEAMELETQHLIAIYERKLAALAALKKSLLFEAFSGKL